MRANRAPAACRQSHSYSFVPSSSVLSARSHPWRNAHERPHIILHAFQILLRFPDPLASPGKRVQRSQTTVRMLPSQPRAPLRLSVRCTRFPREETPTAVHIRLENAPGFSDSHPLPSQVIRGHAMPDSLSPMPWPCVVFADSQAASTHRRAAALRLSAPVWGLTR